MYKKVLIIKLCCLGDVMQVLPSLKALKDSDCEVHYLCVEYVKDLLELIPYIDKIHIINLKSAISVLKTLFILNKQNYDLVINFHRDFKSFLFTFFIKAKMKAGFKWGISNFFLTKSLNFDTKIHETQRYLSIVKGLGYPVKDETAQIKIPDKPYQDFILTNNKKTGLFPGGGINPGTVMYTKRWPIENFIKLTDMLTKDGFSIYIFGGLMDQSIITQIKNSFPKVKEIITKHIHDFVYYVSKMDIFIAPDTGPLHIAAATGVKTIGLFGPSSPELVAPEGKNSVFIKGEKDCSPCYVPETVHKREFLKCKDNICMKNITPDIVYKKIKEMI